MQEIRNHRGVEYKKVRRPHQNLQPGLSFINMTTCDGSSLKIQPDLSLSSTSYPDWYLMGYSGCCVLEVYRSSSDPTIILYLSVDSSGNVYTDIAPSNKSMFVKTYSAGVTTFKVINTSYYLSIDGSGNVITSTTLDSKAKWYVGSVGTKYTLQNSSSSNYLYGDVDGKTVTTKTLPGSPPITFYWNIDYMLCYMLFYYDAAGYHYASANSDGTVSMTTTFSYSCLWSLATRNGSAQIVGLQSIYGFWMQNNALDTAVCQSSTTTCKPGALTGAQTWVAM